MHLFFENIVIHMYKHWMGTFFKNNDLNNEEFVLSNDIWKEIGNIMHSRRKRMPLEFGQPPRNIFKHSNGFKATEWSNWIIMYSIPFLKNKLPNK